MDRTFPGAIGRIPRPIALFFIKATVLFVIWKVLYLALLSPTRMLDEPLTRSVGIVTAGVLNLVSAGHGFSAVESPASIEVDGGVISGNVMDIYLDGKKTLRIADACNGLELLVLYAGFLICYPSPGARKWKFGLLGFFLIYVLNIIRCTALVEIFLHYNKYLDFSHHFAFTFIVYGFIFLLWYFFTKNPGRNEPAV